MVFSSVNQIQESLLNTLKEFKIDKYDLDDILNKIKREFIREKIKEYNVLNIERHKLKDENNFIKDKLCFKKLLYDNEFNFNKIENIIKDSFKEYDKDFKINESLLFLSIEKVFNKEKKNYFSLYDFKKNKTKEELNLLIEKEIKGLKKIPLVYNSSDYYIKRYLDNLKAVLSLLLGININLEYEYKKDYKLYSVDIEKVKIDFYKDFINITFKDSKQDLIFKELLIKQVKKRFSFD